MWEKFYIDVSTEKVVLFLKQQRQATLKRGCYSVERNAGVEGIQLSLLISVNCFVNLKNHIQA